MDSLVFSVQEFLKILPGIAIFPLAFYLAWKKIGFSVSCSVTSGISRISANRITGIVLTNNKDRPITVFEIRCVINKDISFEVEEFDPPMIIKPLESIAISTSPYSGLYIEGEEWEFDFSLSKSLDIYLSTPGKIVKCNVVSSSRLNVFQNFLHFRNCYKETKKFNDVVYNEKAKYVITYKDNSEVKTAIVDAFGFINGDWDYCYNMISRECMESIDGVKEFLKISRAAEVFHIYAVDDLEKSCS